MTSCRVVDVAKTKCRLHCEVSSHFFPLFLKDLKACNRLNKHCYKRCFSCCKCMSKYVSTVDAHLLSKHRLLDWWKWSLPDAEGRQQVQGVKFSSCDAKIEPLFLLFLFFSFFLKM